MAKVEAEGCYLLVSEGRMAYTVRFGSHDEHIRFSTLLVNAT
jgi:hypothetical protein